MTETKRTGAKMSSRGAIGGLAVMVTLSTVDSLALERMVEVPASDDDLSWDVANTCAVTYANICTGWMWIIGGSEYERYGVIFEPCCENARLEATRLMFSSRPSYGYVYGTVQVSVVTEDGCVGSVLARQDFWTSAGGTPVQTWGVDCHGPVLVTFMSTYNYGYVGLLSDHPSAGPTGPQAAGLCYPSTRATHTLFFGNDWSPLCPGVPLDDGVGTVELRWTATFSCASSAPARSWGGLKALYR